MNVAEIREQLADALGSAGLEVALHRNDPISEFPAATVNVDSITYDTFGDLTASVACTVTVLVSRADNPDGWERLDALLSDNTIADALRTAQCVSNVGAYEQIGYDVEYDAGVHIGFLISVEVLT